ncbi:MAG: cyclase [Herbinix sp.]|jgi:arylformamidase|nr:cyclase [Herbinix sp.]
MMMNNITMTLYDISMPITYEMSVYKGKESKRPILTAVSDFNTGSVYESKLELNLHTGTHIDRALHMIPEGTTMESLNLEQVITHCKVFDFTFVLDKITKEHLKTKQINEGDFVLLKTRNSFENILEQDFVYLDSSGAEYLKELKIKGVGIDSLGIERNQPEHETHQHLLGSDIVILEGLVLKEVEEGEYYLFSQPINIIGAEASPVRAILLKPEGNA